MIVIYYAPHAHQDLLVACGQFNLHFIAIALLPCQLHLVEVEAQHHVTVAMWLQ